MKNNFISLITEKILNEISNEGELSKEISEYKKNSAKIDELKKSIENVLKQIKSGEDEEKKRLALIVKFMQDFNVKKAEGDDWVAELEQIPAFKYPSASYKELWEEAMSKLNEATKKVLKGFENAQLDTKRKQTKPELTIKGKDLKENSNENLTLEDIINLPKDAVVVGGGYKYVKIGKNAWKSTEGVLKDDKHLFEFLNGFDDFGYYFKVLKENIISKGLDWLKGLLLSIKGYKKTVDNLPDLKKLAKEAVKNMHPRDEIRKKRNGKMYEKNNLKEEDKGKVTLKKNTKEDDIKKYTDKGIDVEIEEEKISNDKNQSKDQLKDILDQDKKLEWDGSIYLTKSWDDIYKIHDGGFVVFKSRNFDEIYDWLNSNQGDKIEEQNLGDKGYLGIKDNYDNEYDYLIPKVLSLKKEQINYLFDLLGLPNNNYEKRIKDFFKNWAQEDEIDIIKNFLKDPRDWNSLKEEKRYNATDKRNNHVFGFGQWWHINDIKTPLKWGEEGVKDNEKDAKEELDSFKQAIKKYKKTKISQVSDYYKKIYR